MVHFFGESDNELSLQVEIHEPFGLGYFNWYGEGENRFILVIIDENGTIDPAEENPKKGTITYIKKFDIPKNEDKRSHIVRVFHSDELSFNSATQSVPKILDADHHRPFHNVIDPRFIP